MLPDRVSNPGPLTYESGALPIALRGPAVELSEKHASVSIHLKSRPISERLNRPRKQRTRHENCSNS